MAGSATVGILRVLLTANSAEFEAAMKKAADSAKVWSRNLASIGKQATAVGAALTKTLTVPLVGLGAGAVKAASDFESSFAGIRKTVGDATDAMGNLTPVGKELAQGMRDLAKTIPVNVNELNRIGEAAGQLGIKSSQIIAFTRVMADLAATTTLSSEEAATSLAQFANIVDRTKVQAGTFEFDRLGSAIAGLGNAFATNETKIVDFGLRIASAGKLAGLSSSQILAIGTAMASVGVEAEAGGTAVQKVMNDITESVATGNKNLAVFASVAGLSAQEFATAWRTDAGAAFQQFVEGLGAQGDQAFTTLNQLGLGNERVIRAFLSLAGASGLLGDALKQGSQDWQENIALTREAEQRYKTFENELKLFWAQVRDVGITLGTALLPALRDVLSAAQPLIGAIGTLAGWFAKLPDPVRMTALGLGAAAAAAGPLLWGFGQLATAASTLVGMFAAKGLAGAALTASGGLTAMKVAALGLGQALGAIIVVGASAAAVIELVSQATKLYQERAERAKGEVTEQARRYEMMAKASDIAGRSIHTYAEAVQIVTEHIKANRQEQEQAVTVYDRAAVPLESAASATTTYTESLTGNTKATSEAAEAQRRFAESVRSLATSVRDFIPLAEGLSDAGTAIRNIAAGFAADGTLMASSLHEAGQAAAEADRELQEWARTTGGVLAPAVREVRTDIDAATEATMGWGAAIGNALSRLPELVRAGFTGGGGLGGALKAFVSDIGSNLFGEKGPLGFGAGGLLSGLGGKLTQGISRLFGQGIGTALGLALPGIGQAIGSLIGPLIGKIGGFFKGLFGGVSEEVQKARTEVANFQQQLNSTATASQRNEAALSGWADRGATTLIQVRDALVRVGRSAAEADALVRALWDTDHPERARRAMEEINRVMLESQRILEEHTRQAGDLFDQIMEAGRDGIPAAMRPTIDRFIELGLLTDAQADSLRNLATSTGPSFKQLQQDLDLFKGRIESLGPAFRQQQIDETSHKYVNAIDRLITSGGDVGGILFDAREELSDLVREALRLGTTLPAQMKPWIEELARSGHLLDENGERIEDLSQLHFGEAIKTEAEIAREGWDLILARIDELIDRITGPLTQAIQNIPDRTVQVGVEYDDPGFPGRGPRGEDGERGYSVGTFGRFGQWFKDFGMRTPAFLHGVEAVIRPDQAIPFALDVLKTLAPQMPAIESLQVGTRPDLSGLSSDRVFELPRIREELLTKPPASGDTQERVREVHNHPMAFFLGPTTDEVAQRAAQYISDQGMGGNALGFRELVESVAEAAVERILARRAIYG